MRTKKIDAVAEANAKTLAELIADAGTTEQLRVKIISQILESREGQDFFKTMYEEGLSFGACPKCSHENHWAVPEDVLNQMGWVSSEKDPRIPQNTNVKICPQFQEACKKKKITV